MTTKTKRIRKMVIGYLDKEDLKNWGDILCNAHCMPAVCVKPYGKANIEVTITLEVGND